MGRTCVLLLAAPRSRLSEPMLLGGRWRLRLPRFDPRDAKTRTWLSEPRSLGRSLVGCAWYGTTSALRRGRFGGATPPSAGANCTWASSLLEAQVHSVLLWLRPQAMSFVLLRILPWLLQAGYLAATTPVDVIATDRTLRHITADCRSIKGLDAARQAVHVFAIPVPPL